MAQVEVNQNERIYREKNIYVYCDRPFNLKILFMDRQPRKQKVLEALQWAKYVIIEDLLEEGQWGRFEAFKEGRTSFSLVLFPSSDLLEEEVQVSNLSFHNSMPLIEIMIKVREDEIYQARKRALELLNKFLSLLK